MGSRIWPKGRAEGCCDDLTAFLNDCPGHRHRQPGKECGQEGMGPTLQGLGLVVSEAEWKELTVPSQRQ